MGAVLLKAQNKIDFHLSFEKKFDSENFGSKGLFYDKNHKNK